MAERISESMEGYRETGEYRVPTLGECWKGTHSNNVYTYLNEHEFTQRMVGRRYIVVRVSLEDEWPESTQPPSPTATWNGIGWFES